MAAMQAAAAVLPSVGSRTMLASCLLAGLPIAAIVAGAYAELARLTPLNHQTECSRGQLHACSAVTLLAPPSLALPAASAVPRCSPSPPLVAVMAQLGLFLQPLGEKPGHPNSELATRPTSQLA